MRTVLIRLWRDFRFPLILAFGFLPIPLVLGAYQAPAMVDWLWLWPTAYVLLDALSTRVRGRWRIAYGGFELAVMGGLTWIFSGAAQDKITAFVPILYLVLLLVGLPLGAEKRNERIHPLWLALCIVAHIIGQLALFSSEILENGIMQPVKPWLFVSFFLCAFLALVSLNQANLVFATNGRQTASGAMKRRNLLLVLGFFAIAAVLSFVPVLAELLGEFLKWIPQAIWWLLVMITNLQATTQGEGGQSGGEEGTMLPVDDSKVMPQWLTVILTVIVLALVAAVAVYSVYFLIKKIGVFIRYLKNRAGKYLQAVSEDYVDEISDTREDDDRSQRAVRQRRATAAEERRLPPGERVRYRYRRLMQKHPEWDRGSTARENLPETASPIYERVRYSDHPITEAEAQSFAAETKKV